MCIMAEELWVDSCNVAMQLSNIERQEQAYGVSVVECAHVVFTISSCRGFGFRLRNGSCLH